MLFRKPNMNILVLQLRINNANIDEIQFFIFSRAACIRSHITWNLHINEVSRKISLIIGIMKKIQLVVLKNIREKNI